MKNWADKIKKKIAFRRQSDLTDECVIDLDAIAEQLAIKTKAEASADNNLPQKNATSPDSAEREIQAYFSSRMTNINRIVNEGLCFRNTSITDTNLQDERALINNHTEHSKLAVKSLMAREFRALKQLKKELGDIEQEFQTFQKNNKLQRTAHYPDSQLLYFAIILLFWLLESAGNGYFFAEGSELGLLGGVGQAVIIAAINISIAFFLMGWIFRYKNHVSLWKKWLAYISLMVYLPCVFGFNLLVAHYREYFAVQPEDAGSLAVQRFIEAPLHLSEFNSWILFFMGLLFAVFAFIDGYKRDDAYPGYGKLHRRLLALNEEYDERRDDVVMQIEEVRHDFLRKLEEMKQAVLLKHTRLVHLVEDKQVFVAEYEHAMTNFHAAANALIYRYRDINRSRRKDAAPAYFEQDWRPNNEFTVRGAQDDIAVVEEQKQLFQDFPHYCQQRANEIEKLYVLFFQQLQSIDPDFKLNKTGASSVLNNA
ncbi:hypothetical protein [methanotrophic endosymbiont of Bathymodiolus puteoserpentis (Logatchev)]|jgi:precorrin-2 methylase|uniref:hypothetical protein n=1 Tax=methanotrophic endosymbiont of Bathymodiolus puteoserpentis (Logatchev) TaxID=343235 RepID=UPI0013C9C08C|nr:hypothetical protein [methanotrophic endosymbiont of Bathymodiolus puteoserpentis (Logatchev)]SHE21974.1 hypothetical protein BPUTEOMOX_69 [methanotrophic endosymbiont of Bathymodiolus puteoserpentis (Logatchev)]